MKINIAKIETVSLEETISITIDLEGELYNFQAVVYDSPKHKCLLTLSYLGRYQKALKRTDEKIIRNWLTEYFKEEGK